MTGYWSGLETVQKSSNEQSGQQKSSNKGDNK